MANQMNRCQRLVLCRKEGLGRITVEIESFFDFSFKLSEDLQDLIAHQKHQSKQKALGHRKSATLRHLPYRSA